MKYSQIIKSTLVLFLFSVLVSCGSGGTGVSDGGATKSGRVSLLITDGPITGFDQINITLESISFIGDDGLDDERDEVDVNKSEDGVSRTKETIIFDEVRVINLLALQNYSDLLTTTSIPAGTYSKIRLHVSQVELVKLNPDGTVLSSNLAKLPANGKIDLNPGGSFDVVAGGHLMIELDVDARKSIHIVETGNGKFIFRPVIFVNILGTEELKLVILDGRVFAKTASGFQLCKVEATEVNENCLEVSISENTVIQDAQVEVLTVDGPDDNDIVTVLGKANSKHVNALHVVIADDAVNNIALFTGASDSSVNIVNVFDMTTDDDNNIVLPGTALSVAIANGARVFDAFGAELGADIIVDGTDVDVFGLAIPDLTSVASVKAAFVIADNNVEADKLSGAIVAINALDSEVIITVVSQSFSGDVCVAVEHADMFLLTSTAEGIASTKISINELHTGMVLDVYGKDDAALGCLSADVVLVTKS